VPCATHNTICAASGVLVYEMGRDVNSMVLLREQDIAPDPNRNGI